MIDKINITKIVKDHIGTLKIYPTDKYSVGDILMFFVVPLLISGTLLYFHFRLSKEIAIVLVTSLSIFAALLFNLLLLLYDIIRKAEDQNNSKKLKIDLIKEIYANISFCILISIITVTLLIIFFININQTQGILTFFVSFLVSLFILTLLMILKRVHILLSKEVESGRSENV